MNPERMVVKEAMRTFTYLNLYGYLTDAVVVNRVLPADAAEGYFAAWRESQQEHLDLVRSAFAPLPILEAPFFDREVVGPEMLDLLAERLSSASATRPRCFHHELEQELVTDNGQRHAARAAPVRRARRDRPEEDRPRGDRAGGRPEAHDHPAARHVRLRHERRALRGRRAADLLREGRGCTRQALSLRRPRPAADGRGRLRRRRGRCRRAAAPPPPPPRGPPDPAALFVLLDGLRRVAPRELEQQFTTLIREFLLTLRSLIDWYLERLDRPDRSPRSRTSRSIEGSGATERRRASRRRSP